MKRISIRSAKMLSGFLSAVMICTTLNVQPVLAVDGTEEKLPYTTGDVTFSVRAGDLLMAVNPVAWEDTGKNDDNGKIIWDDIAESIGTIDITTETESAPEKEDKSDGPVAGETINSTGLHSCASMEMRERERAWFAAHPGAVKEKPAELSSDKGTEYAVGDWIWHGYGDEKGSLKAEEYMEGATVYSGDDIYEGPLATAVQLDGAKQVYRKYKCLAVGGEKGNGYTIWGYVAGSETNEAPGNELRGKDNSLPTYLSQTRAKKIVDELEEMDFMDKLKEAAGDYMVTDGLGDKDGRIAFFFEPIQSGTLGYSYFSDQEGKSDFFDPAYSLDCLHIQLQITIGEKDEEDDKYSYTDTSGIPPYATMAHELTHYIVSGYCAKEDVDDSGWINEWFAQSVMMKVISWNGEKEDDSTIWDDVDGITEMIQEDGRMRVFAGPTDQSESLTYPISVLASGYYSGRMGESFYRDAITGAYVNEDRLSDFLLDREGGLGKGLRWWRSAFCISLLGNIDTLGLKGGEDGEFNLNPYGEDNRKKGTNGGTHSAVCDEVTCQLQKAVKDQEIEIPENQKRIVHSLSELTEDIKLPGGGSAIVFKVDNNYAPVLNTVDITIKDAGADIVWVHRTSTGEIETDGMPEESSKIKERVQKNAMRNEDGSWDYSDAQEEALSLVERPEISWILNNTSSLLSMKLIARTAVSFNGNRKKLTESILDMDNSSVSINGEPVRIKKVVLKNPNKAYVDQDSIFRETISENNLYAYSLFKEKKKPCYYLVLDKRGVSKKLKKAVNEANKEFKKTPILIEILPVNFIRNKVFVEYNTDKEKVNKVVVSNYGTVSTLKANQYGKRDFQYVYSDKILKITGTNNYNGAFYYDPENLTCRF